jgi:hypothetical protein
MENCKTIGVPFDPKMKLKKRKNEDDEMIGGSVLISHGIFDVCHGVYLFGLGILNKCCDSTHCQSKHREFDASQAHFSIFAMDFVLIQSTMHPPYNDKIEKVNQNIDDTKKTQSTNKRKP